MKTALQATLLFVTFSLPCIALAWGWTSTPPVIAAAQQAAAIAN